MEHRDEEGAEEEERRAREDQVERRSRSRLRALVGVLTAAALVASALTVIAVGQSNRAQRTAREARAQALASDAIASLDVDPEESISLALRAIDATRDDGIALRVAQEALHQGIQADRLLFTIHHRATANVAWSPDGRMLATGGTAGGLGTNEAVLWDARTGEEVVTLTGHEEDVYSVGFSLDGTRVVTTSDDDSAIVWDTSRPANALLTVKIGEGHRWGVVQPRRSPARHPGTGRDRCMVLDASTGARTATLRAPDGPFCSPAFSPDGTADRRIRHVPSPTRRTGAVSLGSVLRAGGCTLLGGRADISGLMFSPDGGRLAGRAVSATPAIWDAWTRDEARQRSRGTRATCIGVSFSRDGTRTGYRLGRRDGQGLGREQR